MDWGIDFSNNQLSESAIDMTTLFTGRELDPETGLYYFRARMYDAGLGRFISRDPIGYRDGYNLYAGWFVVGGFDSKGKSAGYHILCHCVCHAICEPVSSGNFLLCLAACTLACSVSSDTPRENN